MLERDPITEPLSFREVAAMLKQFWVKVKRLPGYVKWAIVTLLVFGILVYSL